MGLKKELFQLDYGVLDLDRTVVKTRTLTKVYMQFASSVFGLRHDLEGYSARGLIVKPWMKKMGRKLSLGRVETWLNNFSHGLELKPEVFEGVEEFLNEFQSQGGKLFISTDSPKFAAESRLENTGLSEYFENIYSAEQAKKEDHLKEIADSLDLTIAEFARRSFMITDGPRDIVLCQKFNLARCVAVSNSISAQKLEQILNPNSAVIDSFKKIL